MLALLECLLSCLPQHRTARASHGQGMVEYALILALVAVVVIAALLVLGPNIAKIFTKVNSSL